MKSYIEETLKFIESDEMRDYLRKNGIADSCPCAKIVAYAPAPIEQKIPVLDLIAQQTEPDPEWDYYDPANLAQECRTALAERYSTPPGTMFWLRDWYYHEEGYYFDDAFFTEFDAAIRYIHEQQKECGEVDDINYLSHSIDKYVPGENGVLEECCTWVLNYKGDIWYFDYKHKFEPENWDNIWDYCGNSLNLPVPFTPGDIILADCRPFAKERRVLIVDIGDNNDCCAVQSLSLLPDGKLFCGAFKHNYFFDDDENSHISGQYRAARWHDDLPENEAPFSILSAAIKANPALGIEIVDVIHFAGLERRDADGEHRPGVKWSQLKERLGL